MPVGLRAPFPWFGGKRRVADVVWRALGDVAYYVEPFAGSLAVLLARPHSPGVETVNDMDGYICNFWRAVKGDPEGVARYADWPVNEFDLTARQIWLVQNEERLLRLQGDADWYDVQVAGWWVWGISSWIGAGWCSGVGAWWSEDGRLVRRERGGKGVSRRLPHLGDAGKGVNRKRPHLGGAGQGVNRQLPHLGDAGQGVMRKSDRAGLYEYMQVLAERLRWVRVCCGDWTRVVTDGALAHGRESGRPYGIFLDPPYAGERDPRLYRVETDVAAAVGEWAREHGGEKRFRIALCGYEGAYDLPGWQVYEWRANRAYGTRNKVTGNVGRRGNERIWFSPGCARVDE